MAEQNAQPCIHLSSTRTPIHLEFTPFPFFNRQHQQQQSPPTIPICSLLADTVKSPSLWRLPHSTLLLSITIHSCLSITFAWVSSSRYATPLIRKLNTYTSSFFFLIIISHSNLRVADCSSTIREGIQTRRGIPEDTEGRKGKAEERNEKKAACSSQTSVLESRVDDGVSSALVSAW